MQTFVSYIDLDIYVFHPESKSPPLSQLYSLAEFHDGSVILNGGTHETENIDQSSKCTEQSFVETGAIFCM